MKQLVHGKCTAVRGDARADESGMSTRLQETIISRRLFNIGCIYYFSNPKDRASACTRLHKPNLNNMTTHGICSSVQSLKDHSQGRLVLPPLLYDTLNALPDTRPYGGHGTCEIHLPIVRRARAVSSVSPRNRQFSSFRPRDGPLHVPPPSRPVAPQASRPQLALSFHW